MFEAKNLTASEKETLKKSVCKGGIPELTEDELTLFLKRCEALDLSPFSDQIYCQKRKERVAGKETGNYTLSIPVNLAGLRIIAERTGKLSGIGPVEWCGEDGIWLTAWTSKKLPFACRTSVSRSDFPAPIFFVAHFDEYVGVDVQGKLSYMWKKMPCRMIAKCTRSGNFREAFSQVSGLYIPEEEIAIETGEETQKEKKPEKKAPAPKLAVPDPAMVGYESEIIPDYVLPAELQRQGITLAMLILEGEEKYSWKRKGGGAASGYDLVDFWAKTNGHEMHPASIAAQALYADIEEPEKAAPSEPPAPVLAGMGKK